MSFPVALSGSWSEHRNMRHGPFLIDGNLYVLTVNIGTNVVLWRSTNGGESWSSYITVAPHTIGAGPGSVDAVVHDGDIYAVVPRTGVTDWADVVRFNIGSQNHTIIAQNGDAGVWDAVQSLNGIRRVFINVRSNGNVVLFGNSLSEMVMGNNYRRIAVSVWNGSSWTVYDHGFRLTFQGVQSHFDARAAIRGDGRVHLFFTISGNPSLRHRLWLDTDFVSGEGSVGATQTTVPYATGIPAFDDPTIAALRHVGGTRYSFAGSNLVWTEGLISGVDPEDTDSNPGVLVYDDVGVLHAFYVRNDNSNIEHANDQGTDDWTTPEAFVAADTQGISAGYIGNEIGVLYNDGGTVKYMPLTLIEPVDPPTLLLPENETTLDFSDPQTFTWDFNPAFSGDTQSAFAFRRKDYSRTQIAWEESDTEIDAPTSIHASLDDMAWAPDGETFVTASGSTSGNVFLYDATTLQVIDTISVQGDQRSVGFSPDGTLLAVGRTPLPRLAIYDTSNWSLVPDIPEVATNGPREVVFTPDGTVLVTSGSGNNNVLRAFNTNDWSEITLPTNDGIRADVSPDGSLIAASQGFSLRIIATNNWSLAETITLPSNTNYRVRFNNSGTLLAVSQNVGVFIYDTSTWTLIDGHPTIDRAGTGLMFSPDDRWLAIGSVSSSNETISVLDTTDWSWVPNLPTTPGHVWVPFFTPDVGLAFFPWSSGSDYDFEIFDVAAPAVEWWDGSDWTDTETWITSGDSELIIPADTWVVEDE